MMDLRHIKPSGPKTEPTQLERILALTRELQAAREVHLLVVKAICLQHGGAYRIIASALKEARDPKWQLWAGVDKKTGDRAYKVAKAPAPNEGVEQEGSGEEGPRA